MKGQVKIILRSPNGDIVKEVEQTNRVFDIPKKIMTEMFPLTIQNLWKCNSDNESSSGTGYLNYNFISLLTNIKDWFRGIKINDEFFEEDGNGNIVDSAYKDWKIPQVYGSDNTNQAYVSNTRYTYANTNYSKETNNVKKLYYSWTMPAPADPQNPQTYFTMRSINLCHYDAVGRYANYNLNNVTCVKGLESSTYLTWKYGNFYFGYDYSISGGYNRLFKNPIYNWANRRFNYTKHLIVAPENSSYISVYPLYNNQIALLRYTNDVTDDYNSSYYVKYINIISNDDGGLLRQFHILQFQGIGCSTFSTGSDDNMYLYNNYMTIISTPTKNYLVACSYYKYGYNYNSGQSECYNPTPYRVWEIPNTQEGYDLLVPCVGARSQDTSVVEGKEYYTRAYNRTNIPGEYVDEGRYKYTLVANPTGNPYSNQYYEITKGNDGAQIPYIELSGDQSDIDAFTNLRNYGPVYQAQQINNKLVMNNFILTFTDNDVSIIRRFIKNTYNSYGSTFYNDGKMLGKIQIPGLQYGLAYMNSSNNFATFPIWYNASCMNLSEPIDIPEGYTLTVEYTITAN